MRNSRQSDFDHALYRAVVQNRPKDIPYLITQGADPNTHSNNRRCVLHEAAYYGYTEVVEALIEAGADVNKPAPQDGLTPAYIAAGQGKHEALARLIAHGAEVTKPVGVNAKSPPLDIAVLTGNWQCVQMLLDNGADPHRLSKEGSNYIHIAAMLDRPAIIEVLAGYGVDLNHRNEEGETPAHYANRYDHPNALWMLRALDADFSIKNDKGETPEAGLKKAPWDDYVRHKVSEFNARQTKRRYVSRHKKPAGPK